MSKQTPIFNQGDIIICPLAKEPKAVKVNYIATDEEKYYLDYNRNSFVSFSNQHNWVLVDPLEMVLQEMKKEIGL